MAEGTRMQQRRATDSVWASSGYVLAAGELGITTDTGIIKIGDGVNAWSALDPAFGSEYLPLLGKAADSELLDGINSDGFVKTADMPAIITDLRELHIARTVTADFTLEANDIGKLIFASNTAWSPNIVATIPTNASVSIAIGSVIEIMGVSQGSVKLTPAGGVTLAGKPLCYGGYGTIRIAKYDTDAWLVLEQRMNQVPILKRFVSSMSIPDTTPTFLTFGGTAPDVTTGFRGRAIDSLGSGVQYDSATNDRFFCRREGFYDININFQLGLNSAFDVGDQANVKVFINGVDQFTPGFMVMIPSSTHSFRSSEKFPLETGDYVQIRVTQFTGLSQPTMNGSGTFPYVQWQWTAPL